MQPVREHRFAARAKLDLAGRRRLPCWRSPSTLSARKKIAPRRAQTEDALRRRAVAGAWSRSCPARPAGRNAGGGRAPRAGFSAAPAARRLASPQHRRRQSAIASARRAGACSAHRRRWTHCRNVENVSDAKMMRHSSLTGRRRLPRSDAAAAAPVYPSRAAPASNALRRPDRTRLRRSLDLARGGLRRRSADFAIAPASADASFRRYFRVTPGDAMATGRRQR